MTEAYRTTSISYQRDDLRKPSGLDQINGKVRRAFEQERRDYVTKGTAKEGYERKGVESPSYGERRDSFMVKRSQPAPQLRPRGPMAQSVEAASFNQSWSQESRAARKAYFKNTRTSNAKGKDRAHEQSQ